MPYCSESLGSDRAARCAVCDGKFDLVRHYSWRTQLCSRKCVDRFRTRREGDRNSMGWLQIGFDQTREGFMTVLADPENVRELGKAEVSGARSR
jgi:hypothetical protein